MNISKFACTRIRLIAIIGAFIGMYTIFSSACSIIFLVLAYNNLIMLSGGFNGYEIPLFVLDMIVFLIGIKIFLISIKSTDIIKRARNYRTYILAKNKVFTINELSKEFSISEEEVRKDFDRMISKGIFSNIYISKQTGEVVMFEENDANIQEINVKYNLQNKKW